MSSLKNWNSSFSSNSRRGDRNEARHGKERIPTPGMERDAAVSKAKGTYSKAMVRRTTES